MKNFFCLALGLFTMASSFAQHRHSQHRSTGGAMEFGLKGGVSISTLKDVSVNSTNIDNRVGLMAGALLHIHLQPDLALQPEVVYSNQGARYTLPSFNGTAKLGYINVPVLLQYMFGDGFRLETGPQVGFLTNAKFKYSDNVETDIKSSFKSTDFSWAFGLGYITHSGFGIDGRYNLGISNISTGNSAEVKNRVWQLGVFYQLRD